MIRDTLKRDLERRELAAARARHRAHAGGFGFTMGAGRSGGRQVYPAKMDMGGWWRGWNAGTSKLDPQPSQGASGSRAAGTTTGLVAGTAVNGITPAAFDLNSNDLLGTIAYSQLHGATTTAYAGFLVFRLASIQAGAKRILGALSSQTEYALSVDNTTLTWHHGAAGVPTQTVSSSVAHSTFYLLFYRFGLTASRLETKINRGSWNVTNSLGGTQSTGNTINLGRSANLAGDCAGMSVFEFGGCPGDRMTDTAVEGITAYVEKLYGVTF